MNDNQRLYLVLCLIYLAECLVWTVRRSVVFTGGGRHVRWRACLPGDLLGNARGGFVRTNLLPPFGSALRCAWLPVALGPGAISNVSPQTPPGCTGADGEALILSYADIECAGTEGKRLLLNGIPFARCATSGQAVALAAFVTQLHDTPAAERGPVIHRFLASRFDAAALSDRLAEGHAIPPMLTVLCYVLCAFLYVLIPVAAFLIGAGLAILCSLPLVLALDIWIACLFLQAHRRLYPAAREGRVSAFLSLLLCPPAAIRARDRLTLDLVESFDPVAVRLALSAVPDTAFYAAVIRDLAHPLPSDDVVPHGNGIRLARETEAWFLAEIRCLTESSLAATGLRSAELCVPPPHRSGEVYCPRCHALFVRAVSFCPDCRGVHTCG